MSLYYLSVTLHVLAALLWLGGMLFLAAVGAPVLRAVEPPALRAQLFAALGERFRGVGWVRDVPARVAMTLLEYAEQGGPLRDGTELVLPRTQDQLAAELATTRESIARGLGRMRREGAIEQRGRRIRIRSVAALEALVQQG